LVRRRPLERKQDVEERMSKVGGRRAGRGVLACFAVAASLTLAACGSSSAPASAQINYTAPPAFGTDGVGATPTIDSIAITSHAPDNQWTVTFKKPVVSGGSDQAVAAMNDAITAKVNGYIHTFSGGSLPPVTTGGSPSTLEGDFSVAMTSPTIVSLRFSMLANVSGSGHFDNTVSSLNLWVPTGATISLADLFTDQGSALSTLKSKAHAALAASLEKTLTWDGKADSLSFFDAWDMTSAGLGFTWPQGKIADQSAGPPAVTLPWVDIKSIIRSNGPAGQFEH
jgi:hypothetical protein